MFSRKRRITGTLLLNGLRSSPRTISIAASILRKGGLVAFPTETVYGLGARADNDEAVRRIFQVKGRPADNPLIVHIACRKQLTRVVKAVPPEAEVLMKRFWPGPLSLVLPRADSLSPLVSAGLSTVAVRMPAHPAALALISAADVPVAAPSANLSGKPSPTTARHVLEDFAGHIEAVLDGGACRVGVESTVVDLTGPHPVLLRPGGVSLEQLSAVLGKPVAITGSAGQDGKWPRSPGMKYRHYAPKAPLLLITGRPHRRLATVEKLVNFYRHRGLRVGLINTGKWDGRYSGEELAARLYSLLRGYDRQGVDVMLAEEVVPRGIGLALLNRLRKAATRIIRV